MADGRCAILSPTTSVQVAQRHEFGNAIQTWRQWTRPPMMPPSRPQPPAAAPAMDASGRPAVVPVSRPATTAPPNAAAMAYPKMGSDLNKWSIRWGPPTGSINVQRTCQQCAVSHADQARRGFERCATIPGHGNRKKTTNVDPGWVRSPHILLVEDDATCRQIGGKFLYSFNCVVDTAVSFQPRRRRIVRISLKPRTDLQCAS